MKKITGILILLALVAIVVIQLASNKSVSENRIYQYDKDQEILIDSKTIDGHAGKMSKEYTGTFKAAEEVKISAEMPGKIVHIYAHEGSNVKKGQTLIKLDDELFQLELRGINEKIADLEKDVNRYKVLTESDAIQGVQLEKTQLALSGAKIQRQAITEKISKTTLKAPFSGVITMKMTEVGSFAGPGMPLMELGNISELEFTINVTEEDMQFFNPNDIHTLTADSYPNLELEGKVIMIGSKGNMGNNFPIQFALKNTTGNKIKSNMFGKIVVSIDSNAASFLIPASAIVGSSIEPQVYILKDGKVKLKSIKTGQRYGNQMEVVNGLSNGDKIAVSGFINLFDGANVKSINR